MNRWIDEKERQIEWVNYCYNPNLSQTIGGLIFLVRATQNTQINILGYLSSQKKIKKYSMDHFYELPVFMLYMKV